MLPVRRRRIRRLLLALAVPCALVAAAAVAAPHVQSAEPIRFASSPADCVSLRAKALHTPRAIDACVADQAWQAIQRDGVRAALVSLQRAGNRNPVLKVQCHLPLHEVGQRAWREGLVAASTFPRDLPADANWNSSCPGGFLHGAMQAAVGDGDLTAGELATLNDAVCKPMDEQDMKGCAHSVGHGISRAVGNDLARASRACERLAARTVRDCISGAVMELNLADRRISDRQRYDGDLRERATVDCGDVSADSRQWCRLMKAKGIGLLGWWSSGA